VSHALLDTDRIDGPPGPYLDAIGDIFVTFGAPTHDSGNVSYGVQIGDQRFFVKTTVPDIEVYGDHPTRVGFLYNAARLKQSCDHPTLPILHRVIESAHGPMLVYDWVDGELLRHHERFRQLPVNEILSVLDAVFELHLDLVAAGWIAVDFYDGSPIYDFESQTVHIVDLDCYHRGPFTNQMGRMFGSSRFMAPEEFELGATIDERTTLFTMGRSAAVFLSNNSLERAPFRGGDALYDVIVRACRNNPDERYSTMKDFYADWHEARRH
jgi:serine/threonine-protein kinase